eukprot:TRINITY_DN2719_c0_g1_i1.p1 TRINITY_DN2719_c0_g1~~TRINITY_DN2719_c0_g1_i1.p1  ORF type:complete len:192 (-),score=44.78 TRINITY_DN2719_c0_g1_i1:2-577(-)
MNKSAHFFFFLLLLTVKCDMATYWSDFANDVCHGQTSSQAVCDNIADAVETFISNSFYLGTANALSVSLLSPFKSTGESLVNEVVSKIINSNLKNEEKIVQRVEETLKDWMNSILGHPDTFKDETISEVDEHSKGLGEVLKNEMKSEENNSNAGINADSDDHHQEFNENDEENDIPSVIFDNPDYSGIEYI